MRGMLRKMDAGFAIPIPLAPASGPSRTGKSRMRSPLMLRRPCLEIETYQPNI